VALPETREGLVEAGYEFTGESRCTGKDCGEYIEWWATPDNRRMPISVIDVKDETKPFPQPILRTIRVPHWKTCKNAQDFRRKK
jgi:hypothetical protein